jgi:hypothetical protein
MKQILPCIQFDRDDEPAVGNQSVVRLEKFVALQTYVRYSVILTNKYVSVSVTTRL